MYDGKKEVAIVDVESVLDIETGDRTKKVTKGTRVVVNVDIAGVYTMQLGQAQGFNLTYSINIPKRYYNKEKYAFFDDQLYTIATITKAKSPTNMLLNVAELEDEETESAIRKWLNGGVTNDNT